MCPLNKKKTEEIWWFWWIAFFFEERYSYLLNKSMTDERRETIAQEIGYIVAGRGRTTG